MQQRRILKVSGPDARSFLQGLVTNDVARLADGLVYAALLTPQGKYLSDFFLVPDGRDILLDCPDAQSSALMQRLSMYKLRAAVEITVAECHVHRGLGPAPGDGRIDPRSAALGWRAYRSTPQQDDGVDWDALRVGHMIPEAGIELHPDTFILEVGFERLHGVDFRKGCYVGQEVTARMKHKTELRKGLARVALSGPAAHGTPVIAGGKAAGTVHTVCGNEALAYLRFDRADNGLHAGPATVTVLERAV